MPDEKTPVESSPTEEPVAVENFTDEQRSEWLKSGKLPDGKEEPAKEAESSAAPEGEKPKEKESETKTGSEPEEAQTEEHKPKGATERKAQLASDIQDSLRRRKELRSEVQLLEHKRAELTVAPTPAQEKKPEEEPRPKQEDFETFAEYDVAEDKWRQDSTNRTVSAALQKDREERATEEQKTKQDTLTQELTSSWKSKVEESRKQHNDFNDFLTDDGLVGKIQPGSVVDAAILSRKEGAELFYYLGKNPKELDSIQKLPSPIDQVFALAELERKLVEGRGSVKRVTDALPPATELAGTGTVEEDPIARALQEGNTAEYMRLQNAKEAASLKTS
ncbi:hypothetical protein LCGC14_1511040 [marine sediment metagenome]|uniref:Uncharacterized protein n=1 Tax=marine sediment metagenome TaxID=412755 RepID=A0A0F9J1G2_9ZZZZ